MDGSGASHSELTVSWSGTGRNSGAALLGTVGDQCSERCEFSQCWSRDGIPFGTGPVQWSIQYPVTVQYNMLSYYLSPTGLELAVLFIIRIIYCIMYNTYYVLCNPEQFLQRV